MKVINQSQEVMFCDILIVVTHSPIQTRDFLFGKKFPYLREILEEITSFYWLTIFIQ